MSLAIDIDRVAEVLLTDGWHRVADNSFELDAYEYLRASEQEVGDKGASMRLKGGQEKLVAATGARWLERDASKKERLVYCPVTAILAVTYGWHDKAKSTSTAVPIGVGKNPSWEPS